MIESTQSKTRDIPIWLTGLVLLLCIGGGGWLIMWYMRDNPNHVVEIPEDKTANYAAGGKGAWRNASGGNQGGTRLPKINPDADGIQASGRSSFRAKIGNTLMLINSSGSNRYDFVLQPLNARTAEEAEMSVMRMSLLSDANWREHLKLTEEQLTQLRSKVPPPQQAIKLDVNDRNHLPGLWKTYQDAAAAVKPGAEKAFLAAVDELGKKNIAAFKQYEATRTEAIKAALTPEQIKLYRSVGGTKAPAAAPKPAVPAAVPVAAPTPPSVPAPSVPAP